MTAKIYQQTCVFYWGKNLAKQLLSNKDPLKEPRTHISHELMLNHNRIFSILKQMWVNPKTGAQGPDKISVYWVDKMAAVDPAFFVLYAFMFLIFSFLLFLVVICCKYAIFESDQTKENLRKTKENTPLLLAEPSQILPDTYTVYQQNWSSKKIKVFVPFWKRPKHWLSP